MASHPKSFESVAEAQRLAEKRLPKAVGAALRAGLEQAQTVEQNIAAFDELRFVPRIATGLSGPRDQATTVLGEQISFPVVISPTGAQGIRPEGEVAVARAAAAAETAAGLSSFGSKPVEQFVAANPKAFLQMYWLGRERMPGLVERARAAGAKALFITLDYVFAHRRDWGSQASPASLNPSFFSMARYYGPQAVRRPRWLLSYLRNGGIPTFAAPNVVLPGEPAPTFFGAYLQWMQTPPPTWSDMEWLREQWGGPFVIKGITHVDDARRAVEIGAAGISVSNHGGNNLDGTVGTIRLLPAIAEAVGGEIEVLFDGGIRRGADVVKALALGARAVMIGRPYLWGLAANGEAGVKNVLDILRAGIDETLNGLGRASIHDLTPDDLIVAADFAVEPSSAHGAPA
jgi:heme/flavin dehydrogenase (mycofactocin system)